MLVEGKLDCAEVIELARLLAEYCCCCCCCWPSVVKCCSSVWDKKGLWWASGQGIVLKSVAANWLGCIWAGTKLEAKPRLPVAGGAA